MNFDIPRIRATVDLVESIAPEDRLLHMKNLCVNNGIWTVPEDPKKYAPVLFEIGLFGVSAISGDVAQLPRNWLFAARNVLEQHAQEAAA
ncbi:hypothetical protein [uncultured Tateyamaria sp.]|uniref:hypothetical protein n=1 Tax=Tateyamaria sp. 1078 TaxID=3417464 RepID=UPI002601BDF0|nr:hypothetical protein [uncultured Tateyamaria sp.]